MSFEGWKPITYSGVKTNYMISTEGRVMNSNTGRVLKLSSNKKGNMLVNLYVNRKCTGRIKVSRLVATHFLSIPKEQLSDIHGWCAVHINHDLSDSSLSNIMWATNADNTEHKCAKFYNFYNPQGERVTVYNINKFARANNLSAGTLHSVFTGKRMQHKGWTKAL